MFYAAATRKIMATWHIPLDMNTASSSAQMGNGIWTSLIVKEVPASKEASGMQRTPANGAKAL